MIKKLFFLFGFVAVVLAGCSFDVTRNYQYGGYLFKQNGNNSVSFCGFANDAAAQAAQSVSRTFSIPETIYGKPVTRIEEQAFISNTLFDTIVVPKTVTTIGRAAFYNCSAKISTSGNILTDEGHLPPLGNTTGGSGHNNGGTGTGGFNGGGSGSGAGSSDFSRYAGPYSGTYNDTASGGQIGHWSGNVNNSGQMGISIDGRPPIYSQLSSNGSFSFTDGGVNITGRIDTTGAVSGTMRASGQLIGTLAGHKM